DLRENTHSSILPGGPVANLRERSCETNMPTVHHSIIRHPRRCACETATAVTHSPRPRTLPEVQGGVTARNSPNGQPGKGNGACTAADPDTDPCRVGRKRHSVVNHIRIGRAQFGKTG